MAEVIKDNCHVWTYLSTANTSSAKAIVEKLGRYTTISTSNSTSNNTSSSATSNTSQSTGVSNNLIGRELLTVDEVLKIERPDTLVLMTGSSPAILRADDLSKWNFNRIFNMGDIEFNTKLRADREKDRKEIKFKEIEFWDCLEYIKLLKQQKRNASQNKDISEEGLIKQVKI